MLARRSFEGQAKPLPALETKELTLMDEESHVQHGIELTQPVLESNENDLDIQETFGFTIPEAEVQACIFSDRIHTIDEAKEVGKHLPEGFTVRRGSIMVHMDKFDQNNPAHQQKMEETLAQLTKRFPAAGLVLQLGDKFWEHREGKLQEVPWAGATPPPSVTRMSAIILPHHGRCVLVEGKHLHVTPPSTLTAAVQHALDASGSGSGGTVQGFDKPLVLYCIREGVLQAEKLRPMFSSPDGCKALFAAPVGQLPAEGNVTLRLRRDHAFAPDVTMNAAWLHDSSPQPDVKRNILAQKAPSDRSSEPVAAPRAVQQLQQTYFSQPTSMPYPMEHQPSPLRAH